MVATNAYTEKSLYVRNRSLSQVLLQFTTKCYYPYQHLNAWFLSANSVSIEAWQQCRRCLTMVIRAIVMVGSWR